MSLTQPHLSPATAPIAELSRVWGLSHPPPPSVRPKGSGAPRRPPLGPAHRPQSGRIRPSLGFSSVTVRLMCATRAGQLGAPAWLVPLQSLRLPRYAATGLGAKHVAEMRKTLRNKTYSQASAGTARRRAPRLGTPHQHLGSGPPAISQLRL